jgi:hypothetical protein
MIILIQVEVSGLVVGWLLVAELMTMGLVAGWLLVAEQTTVRLDKISLFFLFFINGYKGGKFYSPPPPSSSRGNGYKGGSSKNDPILCEIGIEIEVKDFKRHIFTNIFSYLIISFIVFFYICC